MLYICFERISKTMKTTLLLKLHKRAVLLIQCILKIEDRVNVNKKFLDSDLDLTIETIEWHNKRLDHDNAMILRIKKHYVEVNEKIKLTK